VPVPFAKKLKVKNKHGILPIHDNQILYCTYIRYASFLKKYISLLPLFFSPLAKQMALSKLYTQGDFFFKDAKNPTIVYTKFK
jgi:hypothetical protein